MHSFQIELLKSENREDLISCLEILQEAFGNWFSEESVHAMASNPDYFIAIIRTHGRIGFVGMATRKVNAEAKFGVYGTEPQALLKGKRVGLIESCATAPYARGRGMAFQAFSYLIQLLKDSGCELIAASSWNWGKKDQSKGIFERMGFQTMAEVTGEAYRQTNLKGGPCHVCGIPCHCSTSFLVLKA